MLLKKSCQKAFSLIEVTISLIVVGILLSALSPVITKKIQGTSVIAGAGAGTNGRTFTADPDDPDCKDAADGSNAVDCKFQIPVGINMINAAIISAGGGGAGASASNYQSSQTLQTTSDNATSSLTISKGMKNVKITKLIGGGAGGGGANSWQYQLNKDTLVTSSSFTIPQGITNVRAQLLGSGGGGGAAYSSKGTVIEGPKSQSDCNPYNALFIPAKWNDGINNACVTKYNAGDASGPPAYAACYYNAANTFQANRACSDTRYMCWVGQTGQKGTCSTGKNGDSTYNACTRTVCTWYSAVETCKRWAPSKESAGKWRIAKISEAQGWVSALKAEKASNTSIISRWMGKNGLQFCDFSSQSNSTGHHYCFYGEGCRLSSEFCFPYAVWLEEKDGIGYHLVVDNGGGVGPRGNSASKTDGFSVRCVWPSETVPAYTSSSGGGGGGGAGLNSVVPDNYLPIGGIISLSTGTCSQGRGGASCASELAIKNGSVQIYALQAYGGNAGGSGSETSAGAGGTGSSTCRKFIGSWSTISCSLPGKNGASGSITTNGSSYLTYSGGIGGNGANNDATGKGGRGGGSSSSGTISNAGSGNLGYARFYYDRYIPAPISGGGGGSGAIITNINIPQNIIDNNIGGKIEIKSGAKGNGASAGNNGSDGAESYVLVKNPAGAVVWGYKALGGKGGKTATSSAGGAGGAGGTCQSYNGSNWVNSSCSSNGIKGGNGVKSTNGSAVSPGASVGSGYGASGKGAANISVNGAQGSAGIAQITYDRYFQAAAGGGGGGGAYIQIKNIKVIPQKTYTVRIGKGGKGGTIGANGQDGGMSYVNFEGITHYAQGGSAGKAGKSANASNALIQGTGGAGGKITTSSLTATYKNNGVSGSAGTSLGFNSAGGNGGMSGIDSKGACGGLFTNPGICQNTSIHGSTLSYRFPRNITTKPIGNIGAGGAGGGWNSENHNQSGTGSDGLEGIIHIWWQTYK